MASADLLVLLSDVDGLYDAPPGAGRATPSSSRWSSASRRRSRRWRARPARNSRAAACTPRSRPARSRPPAGIHMVIASGRVEHPLRAIADGGRCTWFLTPANPVTARKKWIAGSLEPKGTLTIDAGAVAALRRGNSLLPVGVIKVEGAFARGDAVVVRGPDGAEIGRGLVAYDAEDAERIKGRSSVGPPAHSRHRGPRRDGAPGRSGARARVRPMELSLTACSGVNTALRAEPLPMSESSFARAITVHARDHISRNSAELHEVPGSAAARGRDPGRCARARRLRHRSRDHRGRLRRGAGRLPAADPRPRVARPRARGAGRDCDFAKPAITSSASCAIPIPSPARPARRANGTCAATANTPSTASRG